MGSSHKPDELLSFPCHFEFKAFGAAADSSFADRVLQAVSLTVPVGADALRTRRSSGGRYLCVTVLVRLENSTQLAAIYATLKQLEGLCYLL